MAQLAVLGVGPAAAACHVAAFEQGQVTAGEGAGSVTLTVYLQGRQPSCEGTVDWSTQPGSATAGEDFQAGSGTLTFVAGDDREEPITVGLLDDGFDEPDESFMVVLSNPTGGLSGTGAPATVTITDDDEPSPQPSPSPSPSPSASPTPSATTSDQPTDGPSDAPSSTDTPSPTSSTPADDATPSASPTATEEPDDPPSSVAPQPQPQPVQSTAQPSGEPSDEPTPSPTETSVRPSPTPTPPAPELSTPTESVTLADQASEPTDGESARLVPIVIGLLVITGLAAWLTRRAG